MYPNGAPVATANFDETSASDLSTPHIEIGYSAILADGRNLWWRCSSGNDTRPAQGTFDLVITAIVSEGDFGKSESDTVRGTLHAVCPPDSNPPANVTPGEGKVTIDGPF
jgi:hypothetical protein